MLRVRTTSVLVALVLSLLRTGVAFAQAADAAQDYLSEMPTAERVLADIRGRDAMDTRARQMATMGHLVQMMRTMAGTRVSSGPYPNAVEKPIIDGYARAIGELRAAGLTTFAPGPASIDSPPARWLASVQRLETSAELHAEVMRRYFTPAFQARYQAAAGAFAERSSAGRRSIDQGLRDLSGETGDTTWNGMSEQEQTSALAFGLLMILLLLIGAVRELLPFDVVPGASGAVLRFGLGRARLLTSTGVVSNLRVTDHSTSTLWERRDAGGSLLAQYTTTFTLRHEEFDLVGSEGTRAVHTWHQTDGLRTGGEFTAVAGQTLTAVWATRRFRKSGTYVLFRPPGGASVKVAGAKVGLGRLLSPRAWTVFPAMLLAFTIVSSTDLLGGHMVSAWWRGLAGAILAVPVWFAVYLAIDWMRQRRFDRVELPKMEAMVDADGA